MQYRNFGKLGYKVSALGFGAMRLPERDDGKVDRDKAVDLVRAAIDAGVNYVDTAPLYNRGESEPVLGEALRDGYRERVWLSTKTNSFSDRGDCRARLEKQLTLLKTDYLDVYHLWGIGWEVWANKIVPNGILKELRRAQDEGLFRHLFFSFHAAPEELLQLVDTGEFAGCTVQYNLIDNRYEKGMTHAAAKGMAVVVMGPVGGGRLAGPSAVMSKLDVQAENNATLALRYVLAHPAVSCAISGMSDRAMLQENVRTASRPEALTAAELAAIAGHMDEYHKLAELYCTRCDYCQPCPQQIAIGRVLELYNLARVYGFDEAARKLYYEIGRTGFFAPKANGGACSECGECLEKCPQHLDIPRELAAAHAALGDD